MSDCRYEFADQRPRFPEALRVAAPRGFRAKVRQAADCQGVTIAEFVRNAVSDKIAAATGGVAS